MAQWKSYTVKEVVQKIVKKELVLPVVQRNLVWKQNQICELFDTLLRSDSFGGIMTVEDRKDKEPLFAYREFIKEFTESSQPKSITDPPNQDIQYVVDGQQRLSAFYIGITGTYNHQRLYFNLLSDSRNRIFDFEFAKEKKKLPKEMDDAEGNRKEALWESVENIYKGIDDAGINYKDYLEDSSFKNHENKDIIDNNLYNFQQEIFTSENIGIAKVKANRKQDVAKTRNEIVELFRRLNQGGTKLSPMDLMASKLKGFSPENEAFLYDIQFDDHFKNVGFGQDEVLKLIFLLQGDAKKGIADISEEDSKFIQENKDKIKNTIQLLSQYPKLQELNIRTNIPKYFIAYHLFYKHNPENYFKILDTKNNDLKKMDRWLKISLLNRNIFGRGAGWIGDTTGIRKILEVMKKHQNQDFPYQEIINVYRKHPLRFFQEEITEDNINSMDRGFVSNLLYSDPNIKDRPNDKDHIHPQSKLSENYDWENINHIANIQLLDFSNNRGSKKDKEFYDWMNDSNCVNDKKTFCDTHLIPKDEELWKSENFKDFIEGRKKLLVQKINENLK